MQVTNTTCTVCRRNCFISVEHDDHEVFAVYGNSCHRGKEAAIEEALAKEKKFLGEIKIIGEKELLPVRTEGLITKEKFAEAEAFCKNFRIPKPIRIGDILVENFLNTGVHLIALKTVS